MALPRGSGGALRCGICFRDLTTAPGKAMHVVFPDGSMRCSAPEALERTPEGDPYLSTHVVLDSFTRRVALERAFARHILNVPAEVES
jgi:hypothetical protein